jgi:hypothetical protein
LRKDRAFEGELAGRLWSPFSKEIAGAAARVHRLEKLAA